MPSGTFAYVENNSGVQQLYQESTGSAITLNVTGGLGTWILKLAQFGKISQSIPFTPSSGGTFSFSPTLATDTFVNDTLANVVAYTDLNTTQKIYNYSSFFGTINQGMILGSVMSKAFGSLTIPQGLTLNQTAGSLFSVTSGVVTTKTSGLNEATTILSSANFTQGAATLSNNVTIRAANFDSEFLISFIYFDEIDDIFCIAINREFSTLLFIIRSFTLLEYALLFSLRSTIDAFSVAASNNLNKKSIGILNIAVKIVIITSIYIVIIILSFSLL
jgi:hypothetical protein